MPRLTPLSLARAPQTPAARDLMKRGAPLKLHRPTSPSEALSALSDLLEIHPGLRSEIASALHTPGRAGKRQTLLLLIGATSALGYRLPPRDLSAFAHMCAPQLSPEWATAPAGDVAVPPRAVKEVQAALLAHPELPGLWLAHTTTPSEVADIVYSYLLATGEMRCAAAYTACKTIAAMLVRRRRAEPPGEGQHPAQTKTPAQTDPPGNPEAQRQLEVSKRILDDLISLHPGKDARLAVKGRSLSLNECQRLSLRFYGRTFEDLRAEVAQRDAESKARAGCVPRGLSLASTHHPTERLSRPSREDNG